METEMQTECRELADEYARLTKAFFGSRLVSICFFGSSARGNATPESDIDVLIVAEELPRDVGYRVRETNPIHENVRRSEAYRRLRSQGRSGFVSDIFLTPDEVKTHPPILLDMTEDALIVYDRDGFLGAVLDDVRRKLRELGAKKIPTKRGYYWLLKPDAKPNEVVEI